MDELAVYGNWQYVTSANMEGQWTAGNIYVCGPTWQVNEASGDKAIYSSGEHVIHFYYEGGKQTILWDNPETYIDNEDGSYNTDRRFNFDYVDEETGECLGVDFPYGYSEDLYWFRPWWRPFDEPDYTLYRKGWEMGDGVHIATGNYTKTFTDLSIESPGIQSDFIRTYNSTNEEEGSFGIGWDFNIDVSKIIEPAEGWYQVVMPDGSNSTFKEENGSFKCENNRNKMRKSGSDFIVTIPDQTEYYYNSNMKLYKIVDSEGNTLTISNIISNVRTVTDATGRTYKITYNGNSEHQRVIKIEDTTAGRTVTYEYNSDFQLISATNVAGGKETYSYDSNGHMNKITNCYDETENQITYFKDGKVDYLVNASGQKQEYTYDKAKKQTGVKEYDGNSLIKSIKYDYDEKYAVNKNVVTADGQTYDVDKITYNMVDDENKYDEMSESVDIMGNTTKYDRDDNGNVTKTTNPDGTFTLANYNSKNNVTAEVDEMGYATIKAYDKDGVRLIKEAQSLNPLSQADIDTVTAKNFDPVTYLASNESSYAITSHEYYADSYVSGVIGLIKKTTDPEGNITEYDYYKSGNGKGLVSEKWVYGNGISKPANGTRYEYNAQLQVSKETSPEGAVKEYSYDKFNNKTSEKNFGEGNSALITLTEYDKLGRKTAEYAPNYSADKSKGTLYTYYPNDKVKTETDAEGNKTSYKYDAYENEISKTNPDGTVNLTEYDGLQREKATYFKSNKDAEKQILTSSTYDFVKNNSFDVYNQDGSAQSRTSSCLKTVKTTYITADKQIVNETLADFRENVIQEKTNGTVKRTCAYFSNGQLARETDAKGNTKKYEYGYLNLLTKTLTPFNQKDGNIVYSTEIKEYDKNGNNVTVKQNIQKDNSTTDTWSITENEYNALGLLTKVTLSSSKDNIKNITKYFYDNDGTKTKMYTGLSSDSDTDYLTTNYTYDNWNRLKKTTDSTGYDSGSIAYDKNGNILTSTDPNGNVTTNTYDALNRVLTADTVNSGDSSKNVSKAYTYDSMGKIVTSESNNISQNYEYDAIGRLIRETGPNVKMYTYVGVSNYIKYEYAGINNLLNFKSTKYEYDNEMRVSKVYTNDELTGEYTYDKNGNKASEVLANGVISTYTYNLDNKITAITNNKGSKTLSGYEYSYYLDGSDACKKYTENGIIEQTSYTYDGFGRLKTEAEGNGTVTRNTLSYSYDDYGNRINMESEGTENSKTVYSYNDADGYTGLLQKETETIENITNDNTINLNPVNVKQTIYTYDANGNQITKTSDGKTETNTYDGLNQLIGFTDGETEASYTYFADGLRASKTVDGQTTKHIWDANKQIIVDVVVGDNYEATCYVRGTNLLSTYHYWYGEKQNTTYYLQNAHGDVINLSDIDGKLTKTYKYDAFGVEKNIDNSDTNAFRYCGEYFDKESGTIYLRARYYDPSIGRFISRDTFTGNNNDPLSLNLYTYCHNNPILGIDPTGHFKLPNWAKVAIGAVAIGIGVAATVATGGAAAPALLGAAKIVAASTISSAAISGAIGYATGGKEGLKKGLVDGAADGFMWGGIAAGASGLAKATSALCKGSPKTYANGAAGEKELAKMYKHGESQKRFTTSLGDRVVDRFSKNIAHESKVGYRSLDKFTKKQVLKDAELISSGQIKGAEWHFFTSSVTGKGGASKPLQNLLRKSGIKYTRH